MTIATSSPENYRHNCCYDCSVRMPKLKVCKRRSQLRVLRWELPQCNRRRRQLPWWTQALQPLRPSLQERTRRRRQSSRGRRGRIRSTWPPTTGWSRRDIDFTRRRGAACCRRSRAGSAASARRRPRARRGWCWSADGRAPARRACRPSCAAATRPGDSCSARTSSTGEPPVQTTTAPSPCCAVSHIDSVNWCPGTITSITYHC